MHRAADQHNPVMEQRRDKGLAARLVKQLSFFTLDLSLQCNPGETVFLTGPSGSGKTTVLRCLAGLERLDNGFVNFNGECWENSTSGVHIGPRHRGLGLLSQGYELFPHMTVRQNVHFALRKPGEAETYLASMGIAHLRNKKPHEISGGERQRVALCQILASKPRLLLLDEPFSALDIENRCLLREQLATVQRERGLSVVQVTHDLCEALTSQSRVIGLDKGQQSPDWLNRQRKVFLHSLNRLRDDCLPAKAGG